jgi:bacillolysin
VALAHLAANKNRYHIDRPSESLRRLDVIRDSGLTTVRFGQVYKGVSVFGAQYLVHLRNTSAGYSPAMANGHFFTKLSAPVEARVDPVTARHLAVARVQPFDVRRIDSHGLTMLPYGRGVLAYHFTVWGSRFRTPVKQEVFVNARTGGLTLAYNNLQHAAEQGTGVTAHGDNVSLQIFRRGTTFELRDQSRAIFNPATKTGQITTHDAKGTFDYFARPDNIVTHPDDTFDSYPSRIGAVDAHWGSGKTYSFYRALGRNSIDDRGMSIQSTVNAGRRFYGAFWDGFQVVYGNPQDGQVYPFSAGLDVVAHELTHGVTQYSANLVYLNQSGAMNEAYSDYFGNAVDVDVSGTPESSPEYNYLGEDLCRVPDATTFPCPLRNMADGRTTRDYTFYLVDIDNGGVHLNSTIYSGALWDLRKAISAQRADEIVYEALTRFLTPLDGYIAGRRATIAAADTQAEMQAVRDAFDGRGIKVGWVTDASNDARILRQNLAPFGFDFSPPEAGGGRYAVADYRDKTGICCVPEEIFVGRAAGKGPGRLVSQPLKRTVYNEELPAISGRRAVWARADINLDFDIVGRRVGGKLGPVSKVTRNDATWEWFPAIDGRLVAWERFNPAKPHRTHIYARYLGTKKRIKVTGGPGEQIFPQVHGNWVVFWKPAGRKMSIGAHNLKTGERFNIDAGRRTFIGLPDVGGGYLYWYQDRDFFTQRSDNRGSIRRTKLSTGGKIIQTIVGSGTAKSPFWQGLTFPPRPSANKKWVTYTSEFGFTRRSGLAPNRQGRDVFKVRARPGARPRRVTTNRGDQAFPVVTRNRVLWLDSVFGRADLMVKRL